MWIYWFDPIKFGKELVKMFKDKHDTDFSITNFDNIFDFYKNKFLT